MIKELLKKIRSIMLKKEDNYKVIEAIEVEINFDINLEV